ncbi:MAG: acyloxyacyl hydrolase [Porticoccaceae bacterium]
MKKLGRLVLATCLSYSVCSFAEGERISVGAGSLGIFDSTIYSAVAVGADGGEIDGLWSIRPTFQVIHQPGNTYYAGLGALKEFPISDRWFLGIGVAAGYYHQGDGEDLGQALEFYSRAILSYQVDMANQIRAEFGHISNAELDGTNPGTEFLSLNWTYTF